MPAHTPARWVVGRPSGTGEPDSMKQFEGKPYQEYDKVHTTPDASGYRKIIAHIYQGEGGAGSPQALAEQKKNAVLIAAAPELLRYLKKVIEDGGRFDSMFDMTSAEELVRSITDAE